MSALARLNGLQSFIVSLIGAESRIEEAFDEEKRTHRTVYEAMSQYHHDEAVKTQEKLNTIYEQRNLLAIALAQLVPGSGVGTDNNLLWSPAWRTVVYLHLPRGQVTFHMAPGQQEAAISNLPQYDGQWDQTYWEEHKPALLGLIEALGDDLLRQEKNND